VAKSFKKYKGTAVTASWSEDHTIGDDIIAADNCRDGVAHIQQWRPSGYTMALRIIHRCCEVRG
jgi:hypothetical protein